MLPVHSRFFADTGVIRDLNSYGPSKIRTSSIFEPPLYLDARYLGQPVLTSFKSLSKRSFLLPWLSLPWLPWIPFAAFISSSRNLKKLKLFFFKTISTRSRIAPQGVQLILFLNISFFLSLKNLKCLNRVCFKNSCVCKEYKPWEAMSSSSSSSSFSFSSLSFSITFTCYLQVTVQ